MHCWDLDPNLLNPEKVSFIYIQFYTTFINKFSISVSDRICIISLILNCKELDLYFLYLFSLQQSTYLYHHQDLQYRFVSPSGSAEYRFVSPSRSAEYRFVSPSGSAEYRFVSPSGSAEYRFVSLSGSAEY